MENIFWCKNCLNASTRPRITFDKKGWCNACQWMEQKKKLDWKKRETELIKILDKYRTGSSKFDCVVPVSGGKDGSYVAYTLKKKYGMNPLAINISPPLPLEIGEKNINNFSKSGFDLLRLYLNKDVMMFLNKAGLKYKGFPYFGWLIAIQSAVIKTAANFDISVIFYGEDGEIEYGGSTETKNNSLISIDYQKKIWFEGGYEKILNKLPKNLKKYSSFWKFPTSKELNGKKIYTTTWSYFENWDSYRNYIVAKKYFGLTENPDGNEGTFTNFAQNDQALYALHTYLMYLKFGFGRATQDAGIEIRRGAMTRSQAVNLVNLYDNNYPEKYINDYLVYYQMTKKEFNSIIDKWANKKLFKKIKGKWQPKFIVK